MDGCPNFKAAGSQQRLPAHLGSRGGCGEAGGHTLTGPTELLWARLPGPGQPRSPGTHPYKLSALVNLTGRSGMSWSPPLQGPPQSGRQLLLGRSRPRERNEVGEGLVKPKPGLQPDQFQRRAPAAERPLWGGVGGGTRQPETEGPGRPPSQEPWLWPAPGSSGYCPVTLGGVSSVRPHRPRLGRLRTHSSHFRQFIEVSVS